MTIAISLKVNDGVVLAADSASTMIRRAPDGSSGVVNVYNHANKVLNLVKGLPIGVITWGAGSIGQASMATLIKDFRKRLSEKLLTTDWRNNYQLGTVATEFRQFIFEENYEPTFRDWENKPSLGLLLAGYSSGKPMAEEYRIDMGTLGCEGPLEVRPMQECGLVWNGEPEAINRLLLGFGSGLVQVLEQDFGVDGQNISTAVNFIREKLSVDVVAPAMPIQDAIDLSEFLCELTAKWSRFTMGPATVGGPIEIATITKHEGFKWIKRKMYFPGNINPEG